MSYTREEILELIARIPAGEHISIPLAGPHQKIADFNLLDKIACEDPTIVVQYGDEAEAVGIVSKLGFEADVSFEGGIYIGGVKPVEKYAFVAQDGKITYYDSIDDLADEHMAMFPKWDPTGWREYYLERRVEELRAEVTELRARLG